MPTTANDNKSPSLLAVLKSVAAVLGKGFAVEMPKDAHHYGYILGPGGQKYGFSSRDGQYHISPSFTERNERGEAVWSMPYDKVRPSINVSQKKSAKVIAADMQRRLIPDCIAYFEDNQKRFAEHEAYYQATVATLRRISDVVGAPVKMDRGNGQLNYKEVDTYHSKALPEETGDLMCSGSSVSFEHFSVSTDEAEAMLRVLIAMRATKETETPADFRVEYHGSIVLVRPLTEEAKAWLNDNVSADSQWMGDALAVEPRYIESLVEGMEGSGLVQGA
jgi:hypothetical protein